MIPVGDFDGFNYGMNSDAFDVFKQRGILTASKRTDAYDRYVVAPMKEFKELLRMSESGTRIIVAKRAFKEINGVRQLDNGRNAEVEFRWVWQPNDVGQRLEGTMLPRPIGKPVKLEFERVYTANANCALFDDGWRCSLRSETGDVDLTGPNAR